MTTCVFGASLGVRNARLSPRRVESGENWRTSRVMPRAMISIMQCQGFLAPSRLRRMVNFSDSLCEDSWRSSTVRLTKLSKIVRGPVSYQYLGNRFKGKEDSFVSTPHGSTRWQEV